MGSVNLRAYQLKYMVPLSALHLSTAIDHPSIQAWLTRLDDERCTDLGNSVAQRLSDIAKGSSDVHLRRVEIVELSPHYAGVFRT